jgi:hypothetical protein
MATSILQSSGCSYGVLTRMPNEETTMKTLIAAICLLAAAVPASAASTSAMPRLNAATMSCAKIQSRIHADGAVILRFRSADGTMPMFDRYVDNGRYCTRTEVPSAASVPASDNSSCSVKVCVDARE